MKEVIYEKNLNITLIKELLYLEVEDYYEKIQKQDRTYYERKPESLVDATTIEEDLFNNLTTHSGRRRNA